MTRSTINSILAAAVMAFSAGACGSDEDPVPSVTIVAASPDMLDPSDDLADDLSIMVQYSDGDADLGGGVADIYDCRSEGLVSQLAIPAIATQEAVDKGVPIEGTMELVVTDIGDVWPDASAPAVCAELGVADPTNGEAVFCVLLTDLAGNISTGDCTSAITVMPPL